MSTTSRASVLSRFTRETKSGSASSPSPAGVPRAEGTLRRRSRTTMVPASMSPSRWCEPDTQRGQPAHQVEQGQPVHGTRQVAQRRVVEADAHAALLETRRPITRLPTVCPLQAVSRAMP